MNEWYAVVERFGQTSERFRAAAEAECPPRLIDVILATIEMPGVAALIYRQHRAARSVEEKVGGLFANAGYRWSVERVKVK